MSESNTRANYGGGGIRYREDKDIWIATKEAGYDAMGKRVRLNAQGKTRGSAIDRVNKKYRDHIRGKTQQGARGSLAEWANKWIEEIASTEVRPTTLRSYKAAINTHIIPTIGHIKLTRISAETVRNMRTEVINRVNKQNETSKRKVSGPGRANYAQVVLGKLLADAMREGLIDRNVASRDYVKKMRTEVKPVPILTPAQAKHMLRVAIENQDPMASRWATALITGVRQGETIGLTWDRVDFERKEIHFTRQLQLLENLHGCGHQVNGEWPCAMKVARACPMRKFNIEPGWGEQITILEGSLALTPTKTVMSKRALPMPVPLEKILRAQRMQTMGQPNPHNLVWHQPNGSPLQPRADYEAWLHALDAAGLERVKLHTTRHSAASMMSDMGVDREVVMQIFGHTNLNTTAGYTQVGEQFRRDALDRMGGDLLDLFAEPEPLELE